MKRLTEKVRDIVEVCAFTHLHDFTADPALTLGGYHFTDITSDLMAKWIDRIATVKPGQGLAIALAGFRGVGKSHFLATLGAILARPELRPRIADQHVAASAERLSRRHFPLAFIRRGSSGSLFDELKNEIAKIVGIHASELSDSVYDVLLQGSEKAGELPLVLLFDTAIGRETRVSRDDGTVLSEIAEAAKTLGVFVGAALDDDIAGADGPNSQIAGCFTIDYLDQEHLYKIVDTHIFAKHNHMAGVLHEIYEYYREVLPSFRWSEQRFSSLYPLHPATLEIAPLIRLYIQDFALLGFASEAGVKILGRPANSLIGLDEIFDSVETKLRHVSDLRFAFSTYDEVEREIISKIPVQTRLKAKLILKGLLLLSLDGQGSTAAEIAASMLIFDESGSSGATDVGALLESFVLAIPKAFSRVAGENGPAKYCLKARNKEDVETLLEKAEPDVTDEVVWNILLRHCAEKFPDFGEPPLSWPHQTTCNVEWRGAIRCGKIFWNVGTETHVSDPHLSQLDWSITVVTHERVRISEPGEAVCNSIEWRLADLTAEEKKALKRNHLLQTNSEIRDNYAEGLSTANHLSLLAVDKIWQRLFLRDGMLVAGGSEFCLADDGQAVHSLSQLLSVSLAELFSKQYPSHPEFADVLDAKRESNLIGNFLSGAGANNADAQRLAAIYGLPLGLAIQREDELLRTPSEALLDLPVVKALSDGTSDGSVLTLAEITERLGGTPFGLTREARHLVLASLVAARHFEFVTSSGNRINHRSLDLQIVWDDIDGVAKPLNELFSPERLLEWAKLITGNSGIRSLDRSEDRLLIIDSLSEWLSGWKGSHILDNFDALPDEHLTAAIWRTAANLKKSFGAMSAIISTLVEDEVSLDQCVHSVAELFSDSEAEFEKKKNDLRVLRDFTAGVLRRDEIITYLSLCERTDDVATENAKQALLRVTAAGYTEDTSTLNSLTEKLWAEFLALYSEHYALKHDAVMKSAIAGDTLREVIRSSDWAAFECLSAMPVFDQRFATNSKKLIREMRQLYCRSEVRTLLATKPYCTCTFSLPDFERQLELPQRLQGLVMSGLASFRSQLVANREIMVQAADSEAMRASISQILDKIAAQNDFNGISGQDFRILKIASAHIFDVESTLLDSTFPEDFDLNDIGEKKTHNWEHDFQQVEAFVNAEI